MLVDVVELRARGVKRRRDEVKAAPPVRGWLQLDLTNVLWSSGPRDRRMLAMLLDERRTQRVLEPLDYARVQRIAHGAMLIVGIQEHIRPIRVYEHLPQAWWVRPVGHQAAGR